MGCWIGLDGLGGLDRIEPDWLAVKVIDSAGEESIEELPASCIGTPNCIDWVEYPAMAPVNVGEAVT